MLGWWAQPSPIGVRDPAEVHDVLSVPVSHLVDPATRFSVTHPSGYVGPGFDLDHLLLWGFTAGLVSSVLELGGLAQPWDADVMRPLPGALPRREARDERQRPCSTSPSSCSCWPTASRATGRG